MEEPNFFGLSIAYDLYMREVVQAEDVYKRQIIRYIGYLEQIHAPAEYLEQVKDLQKSVSDKR